VSRFLVHSLPLAGHFYPIAAVASALARRGHEVAWTGSEAYLRPKLGPTVEIFPTGTRLYRGAMRERGMTATKSNWQGYIVPVTRFTLGAVDRAVQEYRPDVLVVDQHAIAGALVAHRHGVRWATLAPTSMELGRAYRALPKVEAWVDEQLRAMWTGAGLPGEPPHDLRFSPHAVIGFTGEALAGPPPPGVQLVGAVLEERVADGSFPWDRLDPNRRKLLVSVGTLAMDVAEGFLGRVARAVAPLADALQTVFVAPPEAVPEPPPDALVVERVPMLELLPHLDAVVTHGGLNTVCEALAHGVPLVVAPIKGDQPINAAQVEAAGAGLRVRFHRSGPEELRAAVTAVLEDPAYRVAAKGIADSFSAAGGAPAAARLLERLAERPVP
jgi:UDP:flavonoid glycosyltransferase YjiC (YdhE family)